MATSENINWEQFVKKAINERVAEIAEEEYKEALRRIEERRYEAITGVCLEAQRYVTFERMGQTLRIEIAERITPSNNQP